MISETNIHVEVVLDIIFACLNHIMFMREQIPLPLISLIQQSSLDPQLSSLKSAQAQRKVEDFIKNYNSLKDCIEEICHTISISSVNILIGPTISTPREVFSLRFPSQDFCERSIAPSERKRKNICQRVIRQMISHWSQVTPYLLLSFFLTTPLGKAIPTPSSNKYICFYLALLPLLYS
jgi:hypothetical protein